MDIDSTYISIKLGRDSDYCGIYVVNSGFMFLIGMVSFKLVFILFSLYHIVLFTSYVCYIIDVSYVGFRY